MNLREWLARANRLQHSTPFKVAASVAVMVISIAAFATYFITVTATDAGPAPVLEPTPEPATEGGATGSDRSALDSITRITSNVLERRSDPAGVAIGIGALAGIALVVIWLGLGLTYLGLIVVACQVIWPMWLISRTGWASGVFLNPERDTLAGLLSGLSRLLAGLLALTASFTALMSGLRVLFSGSGPVLAVARNVLAEAVRMKVSLVFMVLLVFFLAALPDQLNDQSPLRYRVQTFLQYGTGGSFWVIAVLVLFFGVATVAFEQRDRQIWQTMTKPVAAWQYILGKWIGVAGLAAVLLAVSGCGVLLFTEYLRQQPAQGEDRAAPGGVVTNDRFILETQVLTARVSVGPEPVLRKDDPEFIQGLQSYLEVRRKEDASFAADDAMLNKVADDLYKQLQGAYRTVETEERFHFRGLQRAKQLGKEINLRFRVDSGSNLPSVTYKITFIFGGFEPTVEEIGLGTTQTVPFLPGVINDDGTVDLVVVNGDLLRGTGNAGAITFPPDGLELNYSVAGFRENFIKAMLVLWVKLAFLAILAITCATFMSFPVACLVAFSVFVAAEGAGFLIESLQYYDATDEKNNIVWHRVAIRAIGVTVGGMFEIYSKLKPTAKLVEGRLISWDSITIGTAVLAAWSGLLYGAAVLVFRRRELATYSGQ